MAPKKRVCFKRCAVLNCMSNSKTNSKIRFVFVPQETVTRAVWLEEMQSTFRTCKMYCCELHFNLEKDCVDYEKNKGCSLKLKVGVLPHMNLPIKSPSGNVSTTSGSVDHLSLDTSIGRAKPVEKTALPCENFSETVLSSLDARNDIVDPLQSILARPVCDEELEETMVSKVPLSTSRVSNDERPGTSGVLQSWQKNYDQHSASDSSSKSKITTMQSNLNSQSTFHPSAVSTTESSSLDVVPHIIKKTQLEYTMGAMKNYPKRFLGIPEASIHVLDILSDATNIAIRDICIIIRKLRLNEPHWQLAIQFELSITSISRIINENISLLADAMEGFLIWPEPEEVQINLPSSFKHRFEAVNTIIDCFEIQIQKPTNAINQVLTYSMYKKCNTIKYLIACLPDGIINFISKGAGGRISDQEIVRNSGFLDKLSKNTMVMADRGFKSIELDLRIKKCTLVRPPSTNASKKMNRDEVMANKRIASLRIHVERAIGRLREFELLKPHATVESKVINKLDYYVCIACGICNIQSNLINE